MFLRKKHQKNIVSYLIDNKGVMTVLF